MSSLYNSDRGDEIGVVLETAFHAGKSGLRLAIVGADVATARARPAGVLRRHGDEPAAVPRQLVVQWAAELEPALIEDGLVQAGLGPDVSSRFLGCAGRRLGHIPHLQVLDAYDRLGRKFDPQPGWAQTAEAAVRQRIEGIVGRAPSHPPEKPNFFAGT